MQVDDDLRRHRLGRGLVLSIVPSRTGHIWADMQSCKGTTNLLPTQRSLALASDYGWSGDKWAAPM